MRSWEYNRFGVLMGASSLASCPRWPSLRGYSWPMITLFSLQGDFCATAYERCIASAMDVGQYKFDLEFLMKSDQPPEIIFRDGSLFPQDAYLDNYILESRRGDFTREAIRDLLSCLLYAQEMKFIYCGVSKNVQLKVYSTIVDWFIAKEIDNNW